MASGAPEAGMAVYDAARKPEEYIALAWAMEEGARLFYLEVGGRFPELVAMFETMAAGEGRHRDQFAGLHRELSGQVGEPALEGAAGLMEGGIDREEALTWAGQHEAVDVLAFAATMEANAHDRYIHVGRAVGGATERAFVALAEAEKVHLGQLMQACDLLFIGDIGRPDLAGQDLLQEQVRNLYENLYKKLTRFPDWTEVYPAHGEGSLCGRGMSAKPMTTLGFERRLRWQRHQGRRAPGHEPRGPAQAAQTSRHQAYRVKRILPFGGLPPMFTPVVPNGDGALPAATRASNAVRSPAGIPQGCRVTNMPLAAQARGAAPAAGADLHPRG